MNKEEIQKEIEEKINELIKEYKSQCLEDSWLKERLISLLAEEKKKWGEEIEPFKVKEDRRFTYYQCCGQIVGIGKEFPKGMNIEKIKCGKCGKRIY